MPHHSHFCLYFGFVSLAVYDAVVAIKGSYEPYTAQGRCSLPLLTKGPQTATSTCRRRRMTRQRTTKTRCRNGRRRAVGLFIQLAAMSIPIPGPVSASVEPYAAG